MLAEMSSPSESMHVRPSGRHVFGNLFESDRKRGVEAGFRALRVPVPRWLTPRFAELFWVQVNPTDAATAIPGGP